LGKSFVIASPKTAILIAVLVGCAVLLSERVQAQWWSRAPADFEECADAAERSQTREAKASALAECNAKFAGRRKPGGGYSYFDFMQNRHFDIAGPNPTPEEQKHIDEEYIAYLDDQRRSSIAAAFTAKQLQLQQAALRSETEKIPMPPARPKAAAADFKSRIKDTGNKDISNKDISNKDISNKDTNNCPKHSFSCEWPRLSEGIKDLQKLFGASPGKDKRG
jgi:hypothetical protein